MKVRQKHEVDGCPGLVPICLLEWFDSLFSMDWTLDIELIAVRSAWFHNTQNSISWKGRVLKTSHRQADT
jgi:hypothetical protein